MSLPGDFCDFVFDYCSVQAERHLKAIVQRVKVSAYSKTRSPPSTRSSTLMLAMFLFLRSPPALCCVLCDCMMLLPQAEAGITFGGLHLSKTLDDLRDHPGCTKALGFVGVRHSIQLTHKPIPITPVYPLLYPPRAAPTRDLSSSDAQNPAQSLRSPDSLSPVPSMRRSISACWPRRCPWFRSGASSIRRIW